MQMKKSVLKPQKFTAFYAMLFPALLSWTACISAVYAQGRRDIPAPRAETNSASAPADKNNSDFPPAPPSVASGAAFPPAADQNMPAPAAPAADGGGAPLWPSVAAGAASGDNNTGNTEQTGQSGAQIQGGGIPQAASTQPVSATEQQILRQLQSQIDMLKNKIDELEFMQLKMHADKGGAGRMQDGSSPTSAEKGSETAPAGALPPTVAGTINNDDENYAVPASINVDALYQLGRDFMAQGLYAKAAMVWRAFGARFGRDKRAADAAFQLGECYYARGLYGKAAEIYLDVQAKYKTAAIAPQNLLKLAQSMANLQDSQTACATLEQLAKQYAHADPAILQQGVETGARLQCP